MSFPIRVLSGALFCVSLLAAPAGAQQPAEPTSPSTPVPSATPAAPAAAPPAATSTPAPTTQPRSARPVDRIVAVVNDEVITANELQARTRAAQLQLQRQKIQEPPPEILERQVLERMIIDRAQLQMARESGVRVDDATVNAAMARIAEANNMTIPALRQRLEAEGISFNQFREDVRQDILLNRLREREVDGRLQISENELDNFIADQAGVTADGEEINLAQILLRVPENANAQRLDETRQRADDILSQLKGGADFSRLAATYSNASEALQGGALGWRPIERLPTLFLEAIKDVKVGDIAPIVRSPNGFHILKGWSPQRGRGQTRQHQCAGPANPSAAYPAARVRCHARGRRQAPPRGIQLRIEAGQGNSAPWRACISVDPSGSRGGDLGWVYPGDTVPEFERAMNALKINEVSEPVQLALRLASDPGPWSARPKPCRPTARASERGRRCASARATRPIRTGCASCATKPTSSTASTSAARRSARHAAETGAHHGSNPPASDLRSPSPHWPGRWPPM